MKSKVKLTKHQGLGARLLVVGGTRDERYMYSGAFCKREQVLILFFWKQDFPSQFLCRANRVVSRNDMDSFILDFCPIQR